MLLQIKNDVNSYNSRSLKLIIVDNTNVRVGASSNNINVVISSSNNSFDNNDIHECLRNNEEDEDNEVGLSSHGTLAEYLF